MLTFSVVLAAILTLCVILAFHLERVKQTVLVALRAVDQALPRRAESARALLDSLAPDLTAEHKLAADIRIFLGREAHPYSLTDLPALAAHLRAAGAVGEAMRRLTIKMESSSAPQLSATHGHLIRRYKDADETLGAERRIYNMAVCEFNERITVFPANLVAWGFRLKAFPLFLEPQRHSG